METTSTIVFPEYKNANVNFYTSRHRSSSLISVSESESSSGYIEAQPAISAEQYAFTQILDSFTELQRELSRLHQRIDAMEDRKNVSSSLVGQISS